MPCHLSSTLPLQQRAAYPTVNHIENVPGSYPSARCSESASSAQDTNSHSLRACTQKERAWHRRSADRREVSWQKLAVCFITISISFFQYVNITCGNVENHHFQFNGKQTHRILVKESSKMNTGQRPWRCPLQPISLSEETKIKGNKQTNKTKPFQGHRPNRNNQNSTQNFWVHVQKSRHKTWTLQQIFLIFFYTIYTKRSLST